MGEPASRRLRLPSPKLPSAKLPSKPPLRPALAAGGALLAIVLVVMLVSRGGDDGPSSAVDRIPNVPPVEGQGVGGGGGSRGPRVAAAIQPGALRFTATVARRSKPRFVRAENRGKGRIVLGRVRIAGRDRRDFVSTDGCSRAALRAGEACTVVVSFVPKVRRDTRGMDTREATVIFSDDGVRGTRSVSLSGSVLPR